MTHQLNNSEESQFVIASGCCGTRRDPQVSARESLEEKHSTFQNSGPFVQEIRKEPTRNDQKKSCCCG